MADEIKRNRRFSSHGALESAIIEERYESLKSIERLLENDMKDILPQRRTSLPVLEIGGKSLAPRGRTSTLNLADYMQELTNARSRVINGLVQSVDERQLRTTVTNTDRNANCPLIEQHNNHNLEDDVGKDSNDISLTENKSVQVNENDIDGLGDRGGLTENNYTHNESIDYNHRLTTHRASIRDDNFQHFLGIRYLEICHKRKSSKETDDSDSDKKPGVTQSIPRGSPQNKKKVQMARSNALNIRIHALAKSRRRGPFIQSREWACVNRKLPPILTNRKINIYGAAGVPNSSNDRKHSLAHSVPPCSLGLQKSRTGVPCHSQTRAHRRYTGRIHALLSKFRDMSSMTQKVEQENMVEKLDE